MGEKNGPQMMARIGVMRAKRSGERFVMPVDQF